MKWMHRVEVGLGVIKILPCTYANLTIVASFLRIGMLPCLCGRLWLQG